MNKGELVEVISEKTGVQKNTVALIINETHETIIAKLKEGDSVKIAGFGTFLTTKREARKGRNPKTGATVDIPEKTVAKFRPGKVMKETL